VGLLAAVAAAAVALGIRSIRRRTTGSAETETDVSTLDHALEASELDVASASDARAAICLAYRRLLDALAEIGAPREPSEAPLEHLARVLSSFDVRPDAMRDLTELFSEARYSTHPMGEPERRRALDALGAARHDLAVEAVTS
jgi:hypothetical protein